MTETGYKLKLNALREENNELRAELKAETKKGIYTALYFFIGLLCSIGLALSYAHLK